MTGGRSAPQPSHNRIGEVVAAILLHEVPAPEALVGLSIRTWHVALEGAIGGAENGVVLAEEGEEWLLPLPELFPRCPVCGHGRVGRFRGYEHGEHPRP